MKADLEPEDQHGLIDDMTAALCAERARARRVVRAVRKECKVTVHVANSAQWLGFQRACDIILKRLG
jgi:hypothetical protein